MRLTPEIGSQNHMVVVAQIMLCFILGFSTVVETAFSLQWLHCPQWVAVFCSVHVGSRLFSIFMVSRGEKAFLVS